jgi:hypothetical protein
MKQKQMHWKAELARQHRPIALFAKTHCWLKGLDGIVLTNSDLSNILGIGRIEGAHIDQLVNNMRELFPHVFTIWKTRPDKFVAFFASQTPIEPVLSKERNANIEKQIDALAKNGIRVEQFSIEAFSLWKDLLKALKARSIANGGIPKTSLMISSGTPLRFTKS